MVEFLDFLGRRGCRSLGLLEVKADQVAVELFDLSIGRVSFRGRFVGLVSLGDQAREDFSGFIDLGLIGGVPGGDDGIARGVENAKDAPRVDGWIDGSGVIHDVLHYE